MNKTVAALALVVINPFTAGAQEAQSKKFITQQICEPVMQMMTNIAEYQEEPLFEAATITQHVNGEWFEGKSMMFVNQETGTYSFITLYPDGTGCMQAVGNKFQPYGGPMLYTQQ